MKKNRSNTFTTGLVITNSTNDLRFPFFELDLDNKSLFMDIIEYYRSNKLDYLCHRTGKGWHWLSPTLLTKEEWKDFHKPIKKINSKCPMTTLRWLPNKYPDEKEIWFKSEWWIRRNSSNWSYNSDTLSNLLNTTFGSNFKGDVVTDLKFVRYPLPN